MVWLKVEGGEGGRGEDGLIQKHGEYVLNVGVEVGLKSGARGSVLEPVSWGSILKQWHWGFDFFSSQGPRVLRLWREAEARLSIWNRGLAQDSSVKGWRKLCIFPQSRLMWGCVPTVMAVTCSPVSALNRAQSHQNKAWFWLLPWKQ